MADWDAVKNQLRQTWLTTLMSTILFIGVTYFLIWAESQTIKSNLILNDLISAAESVDVHHDQGPKLDKHVVHIVGPLRILEPLAEPDYNIQVQAVKLRKRVQMYQWIEETSEQDGFLSERASEDKKTYWYHRDWRDFIVDSSHFYWRHGHTNPQSMGQLSETHIADIVKIGTLYLGMDVKHKVNDYYEIWSDSRPDRTDIKLHSGFYYHGDSPLEHKVGDIRVHFSYAGREDDIYTAVGLVRHDTLIGYSPPSFPSADPICILRKGSYNLKQLHELEQRDANIHTWRYRLLGFVQVFASAMTLHPDWLTLFLQCNWVSNNLRRATRLWANFILSMSYSVFVISLPWIIHKPLFGITVLIAAFLPLIYNSTLVTRREVPQETNTSTYTRWHNT